MFKRREFQPDAPDPPEPVECSECANWNNKAHSCDLYPDDGIKPEDDACNCQFFVFADISRYTKS